MRFEWKNKANRKIFGRSKAAVQTKGLCRPGFRKLRRGCLNTVINQGAWFKKKICYQYQPDVQSEKRKRLFYTLSSRCPQSMVQKSQNGSPLNVIKVINPHRDSIASFGVPLFTFWATPYRRPTCYLSFCTRSETEHQRAKSVGL